MTSEVCYCLIGRYILLFVLFRDDDEQGEPEANTTVIFNDQAQEYESPSALGFKNKISSESNVADNQDHEYEVVEIRKQVKDDVILNKCAAYAHPRSEDEGAYEIV